MKPVDPIFFATRSEWRKWLSKHHDKETEVWILTYKVHTGKKCVTYSDALDEALCYGWIDSRMRRIDDEKHMWRFAPRRHDSIWSLNNRTRVEKLVKQGRMTKHGLAKVEAGKRSGEWDKAIAPSKPPRIPKDMRNALMEDGSAWQNFTSLARSYRTIYIYWVLTAKRKETRAKRIREVVRRIKKNLKPFLPDDTHCPSNSSCQRRK